MVNHCLSKHYQNHRLVMLEVLYQDLEKEGIEIMESQILEEKLFGHNFRIYYIKCVSAFLAKLTKSLSIKC